VYRLDYASSEYLLRSLEIIFSFMNECFIFPSIDYWTRWTLSLVFIYFALYTQWSQPPWPLL